MEDQGSDYSLFSDEGSEILACETEEEEYDTDVDDMDVEEKLKPKGGYSFYGKKTG